jgi:hypothetical protein
MERRKSVDHVLHVAVTESNRACLNVFASSQHCASFRLLTADCRLLTALMVALFMILLGCQSPTEPMLVGQPDGPYRLALSLSPPQLQVGQETVLTYRITDVRTRQPLRDLQVLHERVLHTFIVGRNFQTFAHTHHEDFFPLTAQDLAEATFRYPHVFPAAGEYLIAGEFTYKDRSWTKQFTVTVAGTEPQGRPEADLRRNKKFGPYQVSLTTSPDPPIAGHDAELVIRLMRDGLPVTDLGLYLGTEVHMAVWRLDGEHFGHQHTYTPEMAAMMAMMRDHTSDPDHMAKMMVQMMSGPTQQVYTGPELPVHHVFPTPGVYVLFFECAPGGTPLVADFMVEVTEYSEGADTTVHSIVVPQHSAGSAS